MADGMLFMLRISLEAMAFAVVMPTFWIALAILGVIAVVSYRRRGSPLGVPRDGRSLKCVIELSSLGFAPLLMLALGLYLWPATARSRHEALGLVVIDALGIIEVALAGWLVWRHRRRLAVAMPLASLAIWWSAGAIFTSSMAITDTWL